MPTFPLLMIIGLTIMALWSLSASMAYVDLIGGILK